MNAIANVLVRSVFAALVVAALAGCQYRYNAYGERIYGWQFGQDNLREIDYSNPRLPILPKWRPNTDLWPVPSPYEFNDLSRWSFLDEDLTESPSALRASGLTRARERPFALVTVPPLRVSDNAACAGCSESTARLALLVSRADAVDSRGTSVAR